MNAGVESECPSSSAGGEGEEKSPGGGVYPGPDGRPVEIKDVWASSLESAMASIREVVERYPYVAMDTEFPGVVAKPIGDAYSTGYQYQTLQCNVDLLKIIQLGISFCDGEGKVPEQGCYCWQFNFRFDLNEDMYAEDSIQLLKESGIDFARHANEGIDVARFGELIMMSGLVLSEDVKWVSFHSGYDFGYLIKILTCQTLPADEAGFFELLHIYFPTLFDVKLLMSSVDGLHGGLQRVAEDLKVERIGPMHQAGSDSLLTNSTFFRLAELAFQGVDHIEDKYKGEIYGLGAHAHRTQKYNNNNNNNNANNNNNNNTTTTTTGAPTTTTAAGPSGASSGSSPQASSTPGQDGASAQKSSAYGQHQVVVNSGEASSSQHVPVNGVVNMRLSSLNPTAEDPDI
ncbi:hypothetical protein CTAYLR_006294 [Chrysophaeum taylorii]|uniref:poly(A)-specific ribonuclease n=1 Tax=Chrysophaeum taylorii TaxID=2483200 RepID=A0AAD7UKL0_9STRA|nr:hypothetical protein CTAYLR_006294 [Chrysophaeum taylorii]